MHDFSYGVSFLTDGGNANNFCNKMGIWFDVNNDNNSTFSNEKLSSKFVFANSIGRNHQTAEIEIGIGAGKIWGQPSLDQEFYAGNTMNNFLYEYSSTENKLQAPEGPTIRSIGERQGSIENGNQFIGGQSYWNININFSVPINKLSKPLIPDVIIEEETGTTLRKALKSSVRTAESFIADDLHSNEHKSPEESDSLAQAIVAKDIKPTIEYLADHANIYSLKPLILIDIAQMSVPYVTTKTWMSAGLGVQLHIINARLEGAFVQSIVPKKGNNIFFRIVVENLF
jgi:hypothetical protein